MEHPSAGPARTVSMDPPPPARGEVGTPARGHECQTQQALPSGASSWGAQSPHRGEGLRGLEAPAGRVGLGPVP